ncbi:MAG: YitT family protein [Bacteroidales bacterium]|nr:YitT family protein [Bacteroidales bacterium]
MIICLKIIIFVRFYIKTMPNKVLNILGTWKFWKELIIMTLGMLVGAAAVYYFLVPSKLVIGSISGLSIVIAGIFENMGIAIKVSWVVVAINAILLVMAYFLIGKEFGAKTVYTALILGPLMDLWEAILPYEKLLVNGATSVMGDPWFDLLCFVLMLSICQAILFNINASTGGLDILAKILNKYLHFDIGVSVTIAGAVICLTALAINPFQLVVIGLIGTWINGLAVDYFTASLNRKKRVCIISDDYEELRRFIVEDLKRGCSLYPMKGGYSEQDKVELQAILSKDEFASLMNHIRIHNLKCFITAGNVSEVYGKWNTAKNKNLSKLN